MKLPQFIRSLGIYDLRRILYEKKMLQKDLEIYKEIVQDLANVRPCKGSEEVAELIKRAKDLRDL